MSGHPPFPVQILLNGHQVLERQAGRAGIVFEKEGNCFTRISDPAGFRQIADTFTEESVTGRLTAVCKRWIYTSCLCLALDLEQQERSGFQYQYWTYQFEFSRNLMFAVGHPRKQVMEALVDRNRVGLDVQTLKTIVGRKQRRYSWRRRKLEDWHITVERPSYDVGIAASWP